MTANFSLIETFLNTPFKLVDCDVKSAYLNLLMEIGDNDFFITSINYETSKSNNTKIGFVSVCGQLRSQSDTGSFNMGPSFILYLDIEKNQGHLSLTECFKQMKSGNFLVMAELIFEEYPGNDFTINFRPGQYHIPRHRLSVTSFHFYNLTFSEILKDIIRSDDPQVHDEVFNLTLDKYLAQLKPQIKVQHTYVWQVFMGTYTNNPTRWVDNNEIPGLQLDSLRRRARFNCFNHKQRNTCDEYDTYISFVSRLTPDQKEIFIQMIQSDIENFLSTDGVFNQPLNKDNFHQTQNEINDICLSSAKTFYQNYQIIQ